MKHCRRIMALLLTMILVGSALVGCGKSTAKNDSNSSNGNTATVTKTASDNILKFQLGVAIDSMDPQVANDGTSFSVIAQCMEGLYTKDKDGAPILAMAKSVKKSKDGLTYTFTLRDDAKWSNGDPVTADDFVYAWDRLGSPELASEYQFFVETACLKNAADVMSGKMDPSKLGVSAKDDKTLVVKLSSPCAIFETLMTFPSFYPVNRKFAESCGSNFATSPDTILCNGPFNITQYEPSGLTISAKKSDTYYDKNTVALDGIQFQVNLDNQTSVMSYQSGKLDVVTLTGDLIEQYKDDPSFTTIQDGYMWYLSPNFKVKGLDNKNIRLALAKSFNKKAITESILKDGSLPADYFVPVNLAKSPSGEEYRKQVGDYTNFKYDVAAAQKYWAQGLKELGVKNLTYKLMCEDSDSAQKVAQFLQNEWQTNLPGLTVKLTVEPKKARIDDMKNGKYDIGLTRWGPDYADPMTYIDMYVTDSVTNYAKWSNSEYDKLVESAKYGDLALNLNDRWNALIKCEGMLANDCVLMPTYQQATAYMISSSVTGIQFYNTGYNYLFKYAIKK